MFRADQCGFLVVLVRTLHSYLVCLQPGVKVCAELCTEGREGREWQYSRRPEWGRDEGSTSVEDLFRGLVRRVERTSESYIDEPTKETCPPIYIPF